MDLKLSYKNAERILEVEDGEVPYLRYPPLSGYRDCEARIFHPARRRKRGMLCVDEFKFYPWRQGRRCPGEFLPYRRCDRRPL